jgi:hypothetical protein
MNELSTLITYMIYLDDVFGSYPQGIKVGKKNAINSLALS